MLSRLLYKSLLRAAAELDRPFSIRKYQLLCVPSVRVFVPFESFMGVTKEPNHGNEEVVDEIVVTPRVSVDVSNVDVIKLFVQLGIKFDLQNGGSLAEIPVGKEAACIATKAGNVSKDDYVFSNLVRAVFRKNKNAAAKEVEEMCAKGLEVLKAINQTSEKWVEQPHVNDLWMEVDGKCMTPPKSAPTVKPNPAPTVKKEITLSKMKDRKSSLVRAFFKGVQRRLGTTDPLIEARSSVRSAKASLHSYLNGDLALVRAPNYSLDALRSYELLKLLLNAGVSIPTIYLQKALHLMALSAINSVYNNFNCVQHDRLVLAFEIATILNERKQLPYFLFCDLLLATCCQRNWSRVLFLLDRFSNFFQNSAFFDARQNDFNSFDFQPTKVENSSLIMTAPLYYRLVDRHALLYNAQHEDRLSNFVLVILNFASTVNGSAVNRPFELAGDLVRILMERDAKKFSIEHLKRALRVCRVRVQEMSLADTNYLVAVIDQVIHFGEMAGHLQAHGNLPAGNNVLETNKLVDDVTFTLLFAYRLFAECAYPVPSRLKELMHFYPLNDLQGMQSNDPLVRYEFEDILSDMVQDDENELETSGENQNEETEDEDENDEDDEFEDYYADMEDEIDLDKPK